MKHWPMVLTFLVPAAFVSTFAVDDAESEASVARQRISAPIHYGDTMLALADNRGVAFVVFRCPSQKKQEATTKSAPVSYRYRYQAHGKGAVTGDGILLERYKQHPEREFGVIDDGSQLKIAAGHFQIEWSASSEKQGWLYYTPEEVRVQIASIRDFESTDLRRFAN